MMKHREDLDQLQYNRALGKMDNLTYAPAVNDTLNLGILAEDGSMPCTHMSTMSTTASLLSYSIKHAPNGNLTPA